MPNPYISGPNGSLGIWTGDAYDYSMPMQITPDMIKQQWRGGWGGNSVFNSYEDALRAKWAGGDGMTGSDPRVEYALNYGSNPWSAIGHNYNFQYDPNDPSQLSLRMKSGDKEGTNLTYRKDASGNYVPDIAGGLNKSYWDTNETGETLAGIVSVPAIGLGAGLGAGALGLAGAEGATLGGLFGTGAGTGMAAGEGAMLGGGIAPLTSSGAGSIGGGAAATGGAGAGLGGWSVTAPELGAGVGGPYSGMGASGGVPGASSWLSQAGNLAGTAGKMLGGGSGSGGSPLGGLLGAGLGYLDAKSQPDSLTIRNEIDPRLATYAYGADGTGGVARDAYNVFQQQLGQPNPQTQAGQQISAMAGQTPDWANLVSQAKGQWDQNPYVDAIAKQTRDNATNALASAGFNSGSFGNSGVAKQGAEGIANAENSLRYSAFNDAQNRALQSAVAGGNYGLGNQAQQAGLLAQGANLQAQGPWTNVNNMGNFLRALPGNTSQTQPIFTNPWAGAVGGASLGSQIGGSTNWGDIFSGIGSIGDWFKGWNWGS